MASTFFGKISLQRGRAVKQRKGMFNHLKLIVALQDQDRYSQDIRGYYVLYGYVYYNNYDLKGFVFNHLKLIIALQEQYKYCQDILGYYCGGQAKRKHMPTR